MMDYTLLNRILHFENYSKVLNNEAQYAKCFSVEKGELDLIAILSHWLIPLQPVSHKNFGASRTP